MKGETMKPYAAWVGEIVFVWLRSGRDISGELTNIDSDGTFQVKCAGDGKGPVTIWRIRTADVEAMGYNE